MKVGVAIVGGTGYGAGELLRLLASHPDVTLTQVVSDSRAGVPIEMHHPHLAGFYFDNFESEISLEKLSKFKKKVVFYSLPHGVSGEAISRSFFELTKENVSIIDLSGDFRLASENLHNEFYPESPFLRDIRSKFTYGLSELYRDTISSSYHISNPGCFATAISIGAAPLIDISYEDSLSVTALTGSSGGGKALKEASHHPVRRSNVSSYKVFSHQHEPEIVQTLTSFGFRSQKLSFVPLSVPLSRGIFASITGKLKNVLTESDVFERFKTFYKKSPFIRVRSNSPEIENVIGTNFVDISIYVRNEKVAVCVALDNLVKGMAGQAIQNMNIMLGLDEKAGLWQPSVRPV